MISLKEQKVVHKNKWNAFLNFVIYKEQFQYANPASFVVWNIFLTEFTYAADRKSKPKLYSCAVSLIACNINHNFVFFLPTKKEKKIKKWYHLLLRDLVAKGGEKSTKRRYKKIDSSHQISRTTSNKQISVTPQITRYFSEKERRFLDS